MGALPPPPGSTLATNQSCELGRSFLPWGLGLLVHTWVPWPASSQGFSDQGCKRGPVGYTRRVSISKVAWLGAHRQGPISRPRVPPSLPAASPFPTSHSCPNSWMAPSGKEVKIPNPGDIQNNGQDPWRPCDHQGHLIRCSDWETEGTEAENHPKPHSQRTAEKSLDALTLLTA